MDDLRDRIADLLNEQSDETLRSLIEAVFGAEKTQDVQCRECGHWTPHPVPDPVARAKAFEILANQSWGKPAQTVRHEHSGVVGVAVAEMSLVEIQGELESRRRALPAGEGEGE